MYNFILDGMGRRNCVWDWWTLGEFNDLDEIDDVMDAVIFEGIWEFVNATGDTKLINFLFL